MSERKGDLFTSITSFQIYKNESSTQGKLGGEGGGERGGRERALKVLQRRETRAKKFETEGESARGVKQKKLNCVCA